MVTTLCRVLVTISRVTVVIILFRVRWTISRVTVAITLFRVNVTQLGSTQINLRACQNVRERHAALNYSLGIIGLSFIPKP